MNFTYQERDTKENSDSSAEVIGDAAKGIGANQQPRQIWCLSQRLQMISVADQFPLENNKQNWNFPC